MHFMYAPRVHYNAISLIHYFKYIRHVFSVYYAESETPSYFWNKKRSCLSCFDYSGLIILGYRTIKFDKSGPAKINSDCIS